MTNPRTIIRDEIRAISAYHVPDPTGLIKLDAMENPYALPVEVRERIAAAVASAHINRYPDASSSRLKAQLRKSLRVPDGVDLLLGNGSDEIIQMLMLAAARPGACVMGVEPAFVMFRLIATFCGMRFVGVPLTESFGLDPERMLEAIKTHQPALTFIAYPNNPTGNLFDERAIEQIIEASSGIVVVDEAYHAFAQRTFLDRVQRYDNLLVMRTLSKSGLAGLRLGLVAGRSEWLSELDKVRLPYNVNVLTQVVAEEALKHEDVLEEQATSLRSERARLFDALSSSPRIHAFPSDANFILFRVPGAPRVFESLKSRGVLIKNLHGAHPALENCLRVTVGTPDENTRFLAALRDSLN